MSFFPQTTAKASGDNYAQANQKQGEFKGTIQDIRPIQSQKNPTVFGVIDIVVEGEEGVFQDYLNFNKEKEEQSLGYLVAHVKQAVLSAGKEVSLSEEKNMDWVENTLNTMKEQKMVLHFRQGSTSRGLNITYIPEKKNQTTKF